MRARGAEPDVVGGDGGPTVLRDDLLERGARAVREGGRAERRGTLRGHPSGAVRHREQRERVRATLLGHDDRAARDRGGAVGMGRREEDLPGLGALGHARGEGLRANQLTGLRREPLGCRIERVGLGERGSAQNKGAARRRGRREQQRERGRDRACPAPDRSGRRLRGRAGNPAQHHRQQDLQPQEGEPASDRESKYAEGEYRPRERDGADKKRRNGREEPRNAQICAAP